MSMISYQIDKLRVLEDWLRTTGQPRDALLVASAIDTIQALSEKVADQNLNRSEIPNSSDLISRKAALAEFVDGRDVYDIMESIESLPSADRPTGEWVEEDEYGDLLVAVDLLESFPSEDIATGEWVERGDYKLGYKCDQCGVLSLWATPFCPNCGAKMK